MYYISPQGEYPRHYGDIQIDNPDWKLGDELPAGWKLVEDTPRPTTSDNEIVQEIAPVETNGTFKRAWSKRQMTAEELERKNAPETAKQRMLDLGFTEAEIEALVMRMVR